MDVPGSLNPYQNHHATEAGQSPKSQHPIPNLHALLIGIDTYLSVTNLTGACNDADTVENFLLSDLSIPSSQITNLRNKQATRSSILAALNALRLNPHIAPLDPILIYYAGHGCEVDTPSTDWGRYDEKTQCLVPCDAGSQDAEGNRIPPIPDYTIAALLYALAAEKGNNITVILDCCHAASSTRGIAPPGSDPKLSKWKIGFHSTPNSKEMSAYRARRLDPETLPRLTAETDMQILRQHVNPEVTQPDPQLEPQSKTPPRFCRFGRSHILLAACAHAEIAYECTTSNGGYFTAALLQRLRSSQIHKLTYKACFEDFPPLITPSLQSPVCEGDDTGRLLFSSAIPTGYREFVPIQERAGGYTIKVGAAQGVIPGSVYGIYEDDAFGGESQSADELSPDHNLPPCGTFTADPCMEIKLYPCQSWCRLRESATIPRHPRAKLLTRGSSHTFEVFLTSAFTGKLSAGSALNSEQGIIQVGSSEGSKAILDFDENDGQMTVRLANSAATTLYSCNFDLTRVHSILFSMSQWDWHLHRQPSTNLKPKKELAQLQMYRLDRSGSTPVTSENGVVALPISSEGAYGFKIKSLSSRQLYAYLFYFSTVNQSIKPLFLSVYSSGYVDAPLAAYGELAIGFGNDDTISGSISFRPVPDVGYFRLFLTTTPGDFDSMTQPSPFIEPDKLQTTSLMDGNKYSDGIEIRRPDFVDQDPVTNPPLSASASTPTNRPRQGMNPKFPSPRIDKHTIPVSDAAAPRQRFNSKFFAGRAGGILPPRVMTDSETAGLMNKRDIWDVIDLKVVYGGAN